MRLRERVALGIVPPLAAGFIRLLARTMAIRHVGREGLEGLESAGRHYVHAFWHGHLLLMHRSYTGPRIAIVISQHRDGEYISRTMERLGRSNGFDVATVRGSTTRGGAAALRAAVRFLRDGWDVGITPDGPRGPRHRVQAGVVDVAWLSGAPVVPVAFAAHPARRLGSWDGFLVPRPFARGLFVYGDPIEVPRSAGRQERGRIRAALEEVLEGLSRRAEEEVRAAG